MISISFAGKSKGSSLDDARSFISTLERYMDRYENDPNDKHLYFCQKILEHAAISVARERLGNPTVHCPVHMLDKIKVSSDYPTIKLEIHT